VLAFLEFEQPKKLAHDHRHLSSNSAKIFAIPLYVYKKYRCASFLADTRTSRFTIAPSDKTNDHRPVIVDHNFRYHLMAPSPYLAGLGTTPGKFRARTLSGKPLRKRSDLNFKWPVAHLGQHLVRRPRVCATLSKPILYMGNFPITRRPWNFRRFRRRTAPRRSTFMAAVEKNRADGGRAAIKTHR
jgi:hypothetical protein